MLLSLLMPLQGIQPRKIAVTYVAHVPPVQVRFKMLHKLVEGVEPPLAGLSVLRGAPLAVVRAHKLMGPMPTNVCSGLFWVLSPQNEVARMLPNAALDGIFGPATNRPPEMCELVFRAPLAASAAGRKRSRRRWEGRNSGDKVSVIRCSR